MIIRHTYKILVIVFIATMSASCSVPPLIKLNPEFWNNSTSTIAVGIVPYPIEGHIYREDVKYSTSLSELSSPNSELKGFLSKFDTSEIESIKAMFSDELTKRGMRVLPFDDRSFNAEYRELQHNKSTDAQTIAAIKKHTTADYVIIFRVSRYGIIDNFKPFRHQLYGLISGGGILIDLRSGEIKWRQRAFHRTDEIDNWMQPPDYPKLAKAMISITTLLKKEFFASFFTSET